MKFIYIRSIILLVCVLTIPLKLFSEEGQIYHGSPLIRNYNTEEFERNPQIWAISQDQRGVMYFGDVKGLLEYDGTSWRRYTIHNNSIVRSIDIDSLGVIYVGANNEFGCFTPNSNGSLKYKSFNHLLPDSIKNFRNVWNTHATEKGVYFVGRDYIFRWHNNKLSVIRCYIQSATSFPIDEQIFVKDTVAGLCVIDEDKLRPLPGCARINNIKSDYISIFSFEPDQLIISFNLNGFYSYDRIKRKLSKLNYDDLAAQYINHHYLYVTTKLSDNSVAMGTIRGGIILLNSHGKITNIINEERGLASNCVYSLYSDNSNNLWAATQYGISRIDLSCPMVYYSKNQGIGDFILSSSVFHNTQYIGTTIKVLYLPAYQQQLINDNHVAREVEGILECWDFITVNNHLLACHQKGISEVKLNQSFPILSNGRIFCGHYDNEKHPNKIFLGYSDGLMVASFRENRQNKRIEFTKTFKIKNLDIQARSLTTDNEGNLWVASRNRGIVLIRFENDSLTQYSITQFNSRNRLPTDMTESSVGLFNNEINVFTKKGIYTPDYSNNKLVDSLLQFKHNPFWGSTFTRDSLDAYSAQKIDSNKYIINGINPGTYTTTGDLTAFNTTPFRRLNRAFSISVDDQRYIKLGTAKSLFIYDTRDTKDYKQPYYTLIRKVTTSNDSILFNGSFLNDQTDLPSPLQKPEQTPKLSYRDNSIKFSYSAPFYEDSEKTEYQYQLNGFDEDWSNLSRSTTATYTNIPAGSYSFEVKAKNIYGSESSVSSYDFIILPPWYLTWWAYVSYFIATALFIWGFIKLYTQNLKKKNTTLERLVSNRTKELQDAIRLLEDQKIELKKQQSQVLDRNEELSKQRKQLELTIKKLKDTQAQLIQTEKMTSLGVLTAGVAHEINNPLNYIMGGYTGLKSYFEEEDYTKNKDIPILLNSIKTGIKRASDIVNGLNQFGSDKKTHDEDCDIHSILHNCLMMLHNQLKERITVRTNFTEEALIIPGNVGKLHQAFINILTNAIQAIEQVGIISVSTTKTEKDAIITIKDSGCGININDLSKVTDPFFTSKDPGKGTGLGLTITYNIIKDHNGRLEIESQPNYGTTITLTLPLKKA